MPELRKDCATPHCKTNRFLTVFHGKAGQIALSVLDPVLSSAAVFTIQGAVLLSASKIEFAAFSLSYSYIIMGQAILSSLFGGPLITLLGKIPDDVERRLAGEGILRLQLLASLLLGFTSLLISFLFHIDLIVSTLCIASFIGLSYRDALRSVLAAQNRLLEGLILSFVFALIVACGLTTSYILFDRISLISGLSILAISAVIICSTFVMQGSINTRLPRGQILSDLSSMAVWSLPGTAVIWLQNSFYLTLVAINLNLTAVGEISAARMLIMPILIITSGMLRLFQVKARLRLNDGGLSEALVTVRAPLFLCFATGLFIAILCLIFDGSRIHNLMPIGHRNLLMLAGAWVLFATATTARGIYSALFQAMGCYREIFFYNAALLPFVLAGIAVGPRVIGLVGAILPMVAGELFLLALLVWRAKIYHAAAI